MSERSVVQIHPTAVVHPGAEIGEGVRIGPYAVIGEHVKIHAGTEVGSHAVIEGWTEIGEHCRIFPYAYIGAVPQDLKYAGEPTRVRIGRHNTFREFVTVHRATAYGRGETVIGDHNFFMAYVHIAHDCVIGNHVIMANAATLAGHILIEDHAIIGGLSALHQYTRVGAYAMIGGASAVAQDVPPYISAVGNRARPYGLNLVGLKRHGFSEQTLAALKAAYRLIFRSKLTLREAIRRVREEVPQIPEVRHFVEFIEGSTRGICR